MADPLVHIPSDLPHPGGAVLRAEQAGDAVAIERIVLAAFGPGRFAKTAERLREGGTVAAGFVTCVDERPVGSVRLWSIRVGETPCLFLGPIAVERSERSEGLGAAMVQACIEQSREAGAAGLLLVGDAPYFGRFGFARIEGVSLPGPVDPARLLWLPMNRETVAGSVTIR
jgi:predicted N-acetyltransferase YhbS